MPTTPRLGLVYPSYNQEPWFDLYERFLSSLDSAVYAHREDRNFIISGGGTVDWDATSGELTWSADIVIMSPYKGYALSVPSNTGSPEILTDGQMLYVYLVRAVGANTDLEARVSSVIPAGNDTYLLAVRRGTSIYWRTGRRFDDGDSGTLHPRPADATFTSFDRHQVTIQTNDDDWIGAGGTTDSAATQGGLSAAFSDAVAAPNSVDVFFNNALCHYVASSPGSINEWTWVTGGGPPAPVIQIGTGSLAGDKVTVKYPT